MSTNVKFLCPQEEGANKNKLRRVSKKSSNKNKGSASFRCKKDKVPNKATLKVIDEQEKENVDGKNVGNGKVSIPKKKEDKIKNIEEPNTGANHHRHLSAFNAEKNTGGNTNKKDTAKKESNNTNIASLNLDNLILNSKLSEKNKINVDEYREMFSKYVRDEYSNSILKSLLEDEKANETFLSHHKITERMRTRMVDWMIEVLSNYHCDESTYFESVNLMDRYFKECDNKKQVLQPAELHLIGVTSMFIASKYQDIYPLRLKIVHDKIAHRKLTCQEIKDKEDEITRYLNYSIGLPTMWDFITIFLEEIFFVNCNHHHIKNKVLLDTYYKDKQTESDTKLGNIINKIYTKNMVNLLQHVCIYLAKMNCHDYNLVQKKPSLLAASTIFVAIKICEQINKEEYINDYFSNKLNELSQNSENEIIKTAQKILYNAQNFDTMFNDLENIKKVHFNAIIDLKVTK